MTDHEDRIRKAEVTEKHILALLELIDLGILKVKGPKESLYADNETYDLVGTPIKFVVFNDCDSWDYLDSVLINGDEIWEFNGADSSLCDYRPNNPSYWAAWLK